MEALVLGETLIYSSFALVFVLGVVLGGWPKAGGCRQMRDPAAGSNHRPILDPGQRERGFRKNRVKGAESHVLSLSFAASTRFVLAEASANKGGKSGQHRALHS